MARFVSESLVVSTECYARAQTVSRSHPRSRRGPPAGHRTWRRCSSLLRTSHGSRSLLLRRLANATVSRDLATTGHTPRRPPAHLSPPALIEHQPPPPRIQSATRRHSHVMGVHLEHPPIFFPDRIGLGTFPLSLSVSPSSCSLYFSIQRSVLLKLILSSRLVRIDARASDRNRLSPCADPVLHSGHRCRVLEVVDTGERTQEHLRRSTCCAGARSLIRDETGPARSAPEATLDRVIASCSPIRADKSQE